MPFDVFLSYARADGSEVAAQLEGALADRDFSVWRDQRSIDPYQDFSSEIELGIRQSTFVVVCLTPSIHTDPDSFVRREILYSQQLGKPVIPAVFPDTVMPILVNHLTWIPFFSGGKGDQQEDFDGGLRQLLERLTAGVPAVDAPAGPDDPLHPYLTQLYEEIVEALSATVFSLVPLESVRTPGAVEGPPRAARALPLTFLARTPVEPEESRQEAEKRYTDLHDAFSDSGGRLLLLGDPGAGKTTTLLAFAREAVVRRLEDPSLPVPIVGQVSTWDPVRQSDLSDWLAESVEALDSDRIERLISSGEALLLLDGLDELGPRRKDERGATFDPRKRFAEMLDLEASVVITCRAREYEDIGQKLPLWGATLLQPFDDQRVAEFLKDQPDLLAAVRADDQLRAVASTPLVLGLFAFAFADLGGEAARLRDLATGPANLRSRITRAFVERRLLHESRRWSEAGDPSLIPDVGEIYQVLGAVAKELALERGRYTVTGRELGTIVGKKNVTRWTELGERLHLLRPVDRDDWRFIHLLIQDHFAVQPLMDELRDRDSWQREQAAEVLAELGDPRAIDCLLEVLRDRSDKKEVRAAAASALSAFDQPEVREALFALLEAAGRKKLAPDLRPPVVLTLGRLGDERVREELISCAHREFQPTAYGHSDLSHWYDNDRGIARDAAEILRPSADPAAQAAVKAYEEREKWSEAERWREWSEQSDYEGHFE